jgi:hypothetical protein
VLLSQSSLSALNASALGTEVIIVHAGKYLVLPPMPAAPHAAPSNGAMTSTGNATSPSQTLTASMPVATNADIECGSMVEGNEATCGQHSGSLPAVGRRVHFARTSLAKQSQRASTAGNAPGGSSGANEHQLYAALLVSLVPRLALLEDPKADALLVGGWLC